MAKKTFVNVGGINKEVKNVWENVGGVWKEKVIPLLNVAGVHKECINYYDPIIIVTTSNGNTANRVTGYDSNLNQLWSRVFTHTTGLSINLEVTVFRHPDPDYFVCYEKWGSNRGGKITKRRKSDGVIVSSYDFNGYCGHRPMAVSDSGEIAFVGFTSSNQQYVTILNSDFTRKTYFNAGMGSVNGAICVAGDNSSYFYLSGDETAIANFNGSIYERKTNDGDGMYKGFMKGYKRMISFDRDYLQEGYDAGSDIQVNVIDTPVDNDRFSQLKDVRPCRHNRDKALLYVYDLYDYLPDTGDGIYIVNHTTGEYEYIKPISFPVAYDINKIGDLIYSVRSSIIEKFDINGNILTSVSSYNSDSVEDIIVI